MNHYKKFGNGPVEIVIELGLGSGISEWNPMINRLQSQYSGLVYERAGIYHSEKQGERTPQNIAKELYTLLSNIEHKDQIILLAHSQGGLYAQQFTRMYPSMVRGLVLLDPLSAYDNLFKSQLNEREYKMSGVDKSQNFVIMGKMARMKLGWISGMLLKKAPPIYYCNSYSKEEKEDILSCCSNSVHMQTVIEEYTLAHDEQYLEDLKGSDTFPNVPLILVTHASEPAIQESMYFGHNTREFATKVENMWQDIMKRYLELSDQSRWISGQKSTHAFHLQEPEVIMKALEEIKE